MLESCVGKLHSDPAWKELLVAWREEPSRPATFAPFPAQVEPEVIAAWATRGVTRLYSHQAQAVEAALSGRSVAIVTPTASGKSLCYNLPVLSSIVGSHRDATARPEGCIPSALYMFPTKALSQDQLFELQGLVQVLESGSQGRYGISVHTYDGDTPGEARRVLRERGDIIVTNPYMLHAAILPHHVRWSGFFRRLRYIVLDEVHVYRGILGSSVANVLRRLRRLARHYGSNPVFLTCSATIRDPLRHVESLTEETPLLIQESGAPRGERHLAILNPPVVNAALGLRERAVDTARDVAKKLLESRVTTLLFGRSRTAVEILTKYLKDAAPGLGVDPSSIVGYRGGYLPELRRDIERGLREGRVRCVAATNALELGIDIGALDAVVLTGYPGTLASYWQQCGRAGRRVGLSLSVLVLSSTPLDQYLAQHPDWIFRGEGEVPVTNPDNLVLATQHLKCAAFELPFRHGDPFGRFPHTREVLEALAAPGGPLLSRGDRYHWMDQSYPAEGVSLDAVESDVFLVLEFPERGGRPRSLGHVDRQSAATTIHPNAIYQHQGAQYQIESLDWEGRRASARRVHVDFYTEAELSVDLKVLSEDAHRPLNLATCGRGDVQVTELATLWKRIRFYTNENLETGPIDLPPEVMDTTAMWIAFEAPLLRIARLEDGGRAQALAGLATLLRGVVPILLQAQTSDLRALGLATHAHFQRPVLVFYDAVPGGIGLAEGLFDRLPELLPMAREVLERCSCRLGCPGCLGILGNRGREAKMAAREILAALSAVMSTQNTEEEAAC